MSKSIIVLVGLLLLPQLIQAQAPSKWPPDSLVNVKVIPRNTPVIQVVGMMRNFTSALGVRCQYCHVGEEGLPLEKFDFVKDEKRTKLVARQMLQMVQEINRRVDTLPHGTDHTHKAAEVTCFTCHRGVTRPIPLFEVITDVATTAGADSAIRTYRNLRSRFYGRDAYDFGEPSLNIAAFRLGRAKRFPEAFAILDLNEQLYPQSSGMAVFRGNIHLMRGDTTLAETAFREAIRRDSTNAEARGRLRDIKR
ncbi:MAG TPA: c-type cytochrome [Longimicrobiales bacterium]|nr:c-type cytochrome [Longimicrobiales bacterium]